MSNKAMDAALLVSKCLNDTDAGDSIRQDAGNRRPAAPDPAVEGTNLLAEGSGTHDHKGDRDQGQQSQLPVHGEHDDNDTDQQEKLNNDFLGNTKHKCLESRGVTADSVDDGTGGGSVIEPHRQVLGFLINIVPKISHDPVAGDFQVIGTDGTNTVLNQICQQQTQDTEQQAPFAAHGQNIVHQGFGHVRRNQGHACGNQGKNDTED